MSNDPYSIDKAEPIKRLAAFVADVVLASIPVFIFWLIYPAIGWVIYTAYARWVGLPLHGSQISG